MSATLASDNLSEGSPAKGRQKRAERSTQLALKQPLLVSGPSQNPYFAKRAIGPDEVFEKGGNI